LSGTTVTLIKYPFLQAHAIVQPVLNNTLSQVVAPSANPSNILSQYCSDTMNFLFQNAFFTSHQFLLLLIFSSIPHLFFPFPTEILAFPIISSGNSIFSVLGIMTFGNILGQTGLYFAGFFGIGFFIKKELKQDLAIREFIHKHSFIIFIIAPFTYFGSDLLMIYAGARGVKFFHLLGPLVVGFALKNILWIIAVQNQFGFLPSFSTICPV
jgi:membrane protein YqaA with SNARE-associated domain